MFHRCKSGKAIAVAGLLLTSLAIWPSPSWAQAPDLGAGASLHGAQVFPADNAWNQDVSQLPVDPNSTNLLSSIGLTTGLHPDFGAPFNGVPNGIPYVVVPGTQAKVPITFDYADESDPGPYPIPVNAPIEGGNASTGDRHVLVIDRDAWKLFELFSAYPNADYTAWTAGSGAVFNLNSNTPRPQGWTSADAAGLPVFPGLVRYDEVFEQGVIKHALRFTVQHSRRGYIAPARHFASSLTGSNYPPMGMRVRLKASFNISGFPASVQVILTALKKYGMIVADNGSNWYVSGAPDNRWNDSDLHTLGQVHGSDFEVVQMGPVTTDAVATPTTLQAAASAASVSLTWAASSNASSYLVKRSLVSNGPYTPIGSSATTSFTDTSVTAGTTYYYVVSGVSGDQQSFDSGETAARPQATQAALSSLTLNPTSVSGGASSTGTVLLTSAAPSGGAVVNLSSSNTSVATVPASVTVAAGATSATFSVTTAAVTSDTAITLTGTYQSISKSATLTVKAAASAPALSSLSLNPTSVKGGVSSIGTVTLSGPAPTGGAVISLSSSRSAAKAPASVTVPAGQSNVTFTITTQKVASNRTATITATYGAVSKSASLTLLH